MQMYGFLILLLMVVLFPVIILSSNHNLFFVLMAIIIFFSSLKNLHTYFFPKSAELFEDNGDFENESHFMPDVDYKRIEFGVFLMKHMTKILFFSYCIFFLDRVWVKALVFLLIFYLLYSIFVHRKEIHNQGKSVILKVVNILADLTNIVVILIVTISKFFKAA